MKRNIYQIVYNTVIIAIITMVSISCKKDETESKDPARIFKPSEVKVTAGATSATLKWIAPLFSTGKALKYTIDFAKDSLFSTIDYTATSDTTGFVVTDENLAVRIRYYARIKAIATATQPESKYLLSSSFQITGPQFFKEVNENTIQETTVRLDFITKPEFTSIVLVPASGNPLTITLNQNDLTAGYKVISGLGSGVNYTAELFAAAKSMGYVSFTTLTPATYTVILTPADNLATTIAGAANNAVIGLSPGTYNLTAATTFITQKSITIRSTSGVPGDTKINYKEFDLEGTGAGIKFFGLELDGTAAAALYFLNFIGSQATVSSAATFASVSVDRCIVHDAATSFLRADRGSAAKTFKITDMTVNNSVIYNIGTNGSSAYYTFHLNKLEFKTLTLSKSTFYNCGPGLITANVVATGDGMPVLSIRNSTFNGFGGADKYAILDANTNPVDFSIQNSILANTTKSGKVNALGIRSSGSGSSVGIRNTNLYKLMTEAGAGAALTFGSTTLTDNKSITLSWTAESTTFNLPADSELRTSGTTGGAIGDPRWTY